MYLKQAFNRLLRICVLLTQQIVRELSVKNKELHELSIQEASKFHGWVKAIHLAVPTCRLVVYAATIEIEFENYGHPLFIKKKA